MFCLFFIPIAMSVAVKKVLMAKASLHCRVEIFCISLSTCTIPGVMGISLNLSFFLFFHCCFLLVVCIFLLALLFVCS